MLFHPWRTLRAQSRHPSRTLTRHKLSLELLEDRSLLNAAALPIPGGFANPDGGPFIHHNLPGPADAQPRVGNDPSQITNFNGFVGVALVSGTGKDRDGNPLLWEMDNRFMQGVYQGEDGNLHQGTFAFV
jgi:hypothetical protein